MEWLSLVNDALIDFATTFEGSPWLFLVLWAFIALDGILPIFPSESLVIGVIALSMSAGSPNIWLVFAVAILGALTGDLCAFLIGRKLGKRDYAVFHRPKIARMLAWAERTIMRRPAPVIISARYIPVGRVAVNFTAGRMGFPFRAFAFFAATAALTWAAYSSLIGVGAGAWLKGHAVIAVGVGVAGGVLVGFLVDQVLRRVLSFGHRRGHTFGAGMEQLESVASTPRRSAPRAEGNDSEQGGHDRRE
jgi:membrane protein DedA with SNARE-associated domain